LAVSVCLVAALLTSLLAGCAVLPPKLTLPESVNNIEQLEPFLEQAVSRQEPPGLSVSVIKSGETVYAKSFGYADANQSVPVTSNTVFQWWSITKLFTAVAILQLQEAGKLSIDDPAQRHLAAFEVRGNKSKGQDITIKQLLSHSSGLGDIGTRILGWVHFEGDEHPKQTALFEKHVAKYNKIKVKPGTQGRYSNFAYLALAALIESVSGVSYEQYVVDNILKPLGMGNTNFIYTDAMLVHAATGSHPNDFISKIVPIYLDTKRAIAQRKNGTIWFNTVYSDQKGASGLIGPASDLVKFMQLFIADDSSTNASIISRESIELMQTPVVKVVKSPAAADNLEFGLAWFVSHNSVNENSISQKKHELSLVHGGSGMAFVSLMIVYPERNLATVVLANSTYLGRTMGYKLSQRLGEIDW